MTALSTGKIFVLPLDLVLGFVFRNHKIMPAKGQQLSKMGNHHAVSLFTSTDVVNMPKATSGVSSQNLQEQVPHEILQVL